MILKKYLSVSDNSENIADILLTFTNTLIDRMLKNQVRTEDQDV